MTVLDKHIAWMNITQDNSVIDLPKIESSELIPDDNKTWDLNATYRKPSNLVGNWLSWEAEVNTIV